MLTSAACFCVRHGRKISVQVANLSRFPTARTSPGVRNVTGIHYLSIQRSSDLLTPAPWKLSTGRTVRCVSLSVSSRGDADPLGSLSAPEDVGNYGSLSADMSSRRSFKKSSQEMQDWRHREELEEDQVKPLIRPGRTNTPYWYFLQCKKLIKENKVSSFEMFCISFFPPLHPRCVLKSTCPLTVAGSFGFVQQRHAAGREAAAGGVQLQCPDRRLRASWTTEEGLQTLQRCGFTAMIHFSWTYVHLSLHLCRIY